MIAQRLADIAIRVWQGDRTVLQEIERLAKLCGVEAQTDPEVGVVLRGKVNAGVHFGLEPPLVIVQLLLGLYGPLGVFLPDFEEANRIARKRWREIVKAGQAQTR